MSNQELAQGTITALGYYIIFGKYSAILTLLCLRVSAELLYCLGERLEEKVEQFLLQGSCTLLDVTLLALDHSVERSA